MITTEEVHRTMQQEHASVMRMLGRVEGTLESMAEKHTDMKAAHQDMSVQLVALTNEVRGYRNYFLGFMAAVSLVTSAFWWAISHITTR